MELAGRTIIVTGAGGGIGSATAFLLADHGASVVLVDMDESAAAAVLDKITPREHRSVVADVADIGDVTGIFELIEREGRDLAGVVNAAGIVSGGPSWPATDLSRMKQVIGVNTAGTVLLSSLVAAHNSAAERVVVNVASVAATRPHPPDPAYAASKAGVLAFTKSAVAARVPRLRVNAVLPGVVRTNMLESTGTDGVAPWLRPRLDGPLLTADQVASVIVELVTGDDDGVVCCVELDKQNSDNVIRSYV